MKYIVMVLLGIAIFSGCSSADINAFGDDVSKSVDGAVSGKGAGQ